MTQYTLADLGWSDHFARQHDGTSTPARIAAVHRDRLEALATDGPLTLTTPDETGSYAVGDWVLHEGGRVERRLEPQTVIGRRAAGEVAKGQLIAANVDTLAIVTSCNADFNEARLERYLAIATAGGALPLILLTKADMAEDEVDYRRRAERLSPLATAMTLDARDPAEIDRLAPWGRAGQTLALVGSSGVGKTTLLNGLTGLAEATQDIREDDARGRHTTTHRALKPTLAGGWVIDTPGMRELRLTDVGDGIDAVFADLTELAQGCRFTDCAHDTEPGCAIQAAISSGALGAARLTRWQKLQREDAYNSESVAEMRARVRGLNRLYSGGRARSKAKRDI